MNAKADFSEDFSRYDVPSRRRPQIGKVLVTGATGYVGGRLVPALLARGYAVRVMVRAASPEHRQRWPDAEIVVADAADFKSLAGALAGIHTAYYLIHSLLLGPGQFESADILNAINFRKAAEEKQVKRIIYLGGLGDVRTTLSAHLMSRLQVAEELQAGQVPATILRAAIIIGSGSASYEIIKNLVRNLPVIFLPRWAKTRCQPICVRDVIKYLIGVLETDETAGRSFDIGGRDILTYEMMMRTLAGLLGRKKLFIRIPFSNLRSYAYLASLLTPVPAPITMCLMAGLKNDVVCLDDAIRRILPFESLSYREALVLAMTREEQDNVRTRWSDAYPPAYELAIKLRELEKPPAYTSSSSLLTDKSAAALFRSITRIGGKEGWFHSNWLWRLRGIVDRLLMGVGSARGRKIYSSLSVNDVVDFWRVEDIKPDALLLLRAEMKLPGRAWLKFRIDRENQKNRLAVEAYYQPRNFLGKAYWYIFLPFHFFLFDNLVKQIEKRS